ncbi:MULTISPECIES: hypothetical protein [unclassified Okeania]|uniref:hypothetical protein n=2 Tax=Okeania TaxID=1458928 RepID=UPI0013BDA3B4|nr:MULTISPECIES: hypothetical protein [unclassified Okeania]NES79782.1 hypothetical protein [Okeania sp. SIO1H4]NET14609.1 hypothetical protein [Okeania sp. SIO1H6]NET23465.1 hypothetical protein [Okeania sp. SIO1H5]NET97230.1 hypothetical protein [Okeania sp. SIO1H2]
MVITKSTSTEKTVNVANGTIVPNVYKLFLRNAAQTRSTFHTLQYGRQIEPEKMRIVLQADVEGSSLRGISRTVNLSYNTVVSLVRAASQKGQMIHNPHVRAYRNLTNQWR